MDTQLYIYVQRLSNPLTYWLLIVNTSDTILGVISKVISLELPNQYSSQYVKLFLDGVELNPSLTLDSYGIETNYTFLTSTYTPPPLGQATKKHTFLGRTVDGQQIYTVQTNLITPYEFTSLPTGVQGQVQWTEKKPIGWASQYGPYYNLFNKVYLRRDGSLETIPNGGGNVHSMKVFGIGSSLERPLAINVQEPIQELNWSMPRIRYDVDLEYAGKSYVKFGVFYKVNSTDPLRSLNFAGIFLNFTRDISDEIQPRNISSYVNYAIIHGGDVDLLGNSSNYTYLNNYLGSSFDARYQWLGEQIIKFKKLAQINQNSVFNTWQYLEFTVPIPTFSNDTAEPDGTDNGSFDNNGPATRCTLNICFGENNDYLDDNSGINSGSVLFYYPFLNLL
jgi:hypothetical protein